MVDYALFHRWAKSFNFQDNAFAKVPIIFTVITTTFNDKLNITTTISEVWFVLGFGENNY